MNYMSGKLLVSSLMLATIGIWQVAHAPTLRTKVQPIALKQNPAAGVPLRLISGSGTTEVPSPATAEPPGPGLYVTRPFSMIVGMPGAADQKMVIPLPNRLAADGIVEAPAATYVPLHR